MRFVHAVGYDGCFSASRSWMMRYENRNILENLKQVARVMVATFGRNCEVAIHDFEQLPHSMVHIEGIVTGRKPGAPITDLVLRTLRREKDEAKDICNYKTVTKDGRTLKSSTAFIRNNEDRVIGALCINFDITNYLNSIALLDGFVQTSNQREDHRNETFASTVNETIEALMQQVVSEAGKQPATMSKEEKVQLVQRLEFQGAFLIRGAVEFVAKTLGVSKFTVYNYLKEVRAG